MKIATTPPTAAAIINYTTTSGIVNPSGTLGQTTTLLGRFASDMNTIINQQLQLRKTIDFSDNPGGFQVLNVPDSLYITSDQFWADFNQPFLQQCIARKTSFSARHSVVRGRLWQRGFLPAKQRVRVRSRKPSVRSLALSRNSGAGKGEVTDFLDLGVGVGDKLRPFPIYQGCPLFRSSGNKSWAKVAGDILRR